MRKLCTLAMMMATLAMGSLAPHAVIGQGPEKPVALVSVAPLERISSSFTYLMRSCGVGHVGAIGTMLMKEWGDGLDAKRPAGLTVQLVDGQPVPLAFLPLDDRKKFFAALERAGQFPDDLGSGVFAFDVSGQTIFAKDAGKWLFISQQEDELKNVPADPAALLGDTPNKYDLAVRLNMQALPAEMKGAAIGQMKEAFERSLAENRNRGQSDEEAAAAQEMGKASIQQMERLLNETEQVIIALSTGPTVQKLQLDIGAQFVAGSELASQMELQKSVTSDFTGLLIEGAAMTVRSTSLVSESDKAMSKGNIRNMMGQIEKQINDNDDLSDANKTALKKFVSGMMSIVEKTIESGKMDGGGAVSLKDGKVRAIFGGSVADGTQVEKQFKDLVASMGTAPDMPKVEFNYGKHKDVNLHRVALPIKSNDPKVQQVFGKDLKVVVGTGPKAFFLSLDPDGDAVIKSALDRLGSTKNVKVTPGDMIVEVGQIMAFAQTVAPNPMIESVAALLEQAPGKDRIRVQTNVIPRGMLYQLSIDEAVLKGIGAAVQAGQTGGAGF